jgi:hypothetical protein
MSWISDPVLRGIDCNSMPNAANTSIKMCIRVAGSPASSFEIVAWRIPTFAAKANWVRPCAKRARLTASPALRELRIRSVFATASPYSRMRIISKYTHTRIFIIDTLMRMKVQVENRFFENNTTPALHSALQPPQPHQPRHQGANGRNALLFVAWYGPAIFRR